MEDITIDKEKQKQAKLYARINRRLLLIDLVFGSFYALAWIICGWAVYLKSFLLNYTSSPWLLVIMFGGVFTGLYYLLTLPLAYYSGYILVHRFGLSTQTLRGWVSDQVKMVLLGAGFGSILLEIFYAILRLSPNYWWLWMSGIWLLFVVLITNLAPVVFYPIFFKFTPLGDDFSELANRLLELAQKAGTHVRGVYVFDLSRKSKKANAALMGFGNTRRIVLSDTLIETSTPDEIETVLAHELGHHVNKDIPIGILVESLVMTIGFYLAAIGLRWGTTTMGLFSLDDIAGLPLLGLIMGVFSLVTMPLLNGFSRWRERMADHFAVNLSGKGSAFASVMIRLANQNLAEVDPEPWVEFLLYSHPAINKRISQAIKQSS